MWALQGGPKNRTVIIWYYFNHSNSNITIKIHKNTTIIFTVTVHGWISSHNMFNVSSLLLDNAFKPMAPLTNCVVNETLWQLAPLCDDCLFQLIHCSETSTTVYHLLKGAPNSVVDWIQVQAVWGPHVMLNKRNVLTSQILHSVLGGMWGGAILL